MTGASCPEGPVIVTGGSCPEGPVIVDRGKSLRLLKKKTKVGKKFAVFSNVNFF